MKVHTSAFKEEINKMGRQIDGKIYYSVNYNLASETNDLLITENNLQLFSEQINESERFEIQNENIFSMSFINNGDILCSLMKEFDFESNIELKVGTQVNPYFGVLVNGEYEYLDYGKYIIKSREYNLDTETWNYVCYDKMMLFMIDYEPINITYPTQIRNFLLKICEKIGVNFEHQTVNDTTWYPDGEQIIIYDELFKDKGYTYRDVLDKISEVYAGNFLINKNNNLSIHRLAPLPSSVEEKYADTFDETFLKDSKTSFNKKIGPINRVVVVDSQNNIEYPSTINVSSEETNDVNELRITDNEFTFNGHESDIANTILTEISGLEYYYCDFKTAGICYLDFLDRFKVTYKNKEYPCLLLNNEITITTGIEENIFADENKQILNNDSNYSTSILNSKETSFIVNKQTNEIKSKVSQEEMSTAITQTADEINNEVAKKVGNDEIISKINQSAEQIQINANKISLEGKEINLTSDNVIIESTNFSVDKNGNMSCNNATANNLNISGGRINLVSSSNNDQRFVLTYSNSSYNYKTAISPRGVIVYDRDNNNYYAFWGSDQVTMYQDSLMAQYTVSGFHLYYNNSGRIYCDSVSGNLTCVSLTQTSKAEEKKNFERLTNAKDILKQVDIYKYNFKDEDDSEKKSIGFVIGDDFNYSKEITSKNNDGANIYSMISVLWQVVKEQQEEINELKEMIKNGKY